VLKLTVKRRGISHLFAEVRDILYPFEITLRGQAPNSIFKTNYEKVSDYRE